MVRYIVILSLLCVVTQVTVAQTTPVFAVKGIVIDSSTQKALDYVTIALKKDNQPFKTTLTNTAGSFTIEKIPAAKYSLSVVSVGYKTKVIPLNITEGSKALIDLGKIIIAGQSNSLKEVVVSADRPIIKQEIDRIGYDVQADAESKSLNALDMMRKVPLLSLDGDDNIKLQGNSNYKILINGKPSSMVARNPKDVLRAMPASSIQKIEVITTPPAKYDSEGLAGIINIITNKKIDNGYNGSISLNDRFPVGGLGGGLSFTVKQGKFGASGFGGISNYNQPELPNYSSRLTSGINSSSLFQSGLRKSDNSFAYLGTELSFEIDTLNLLTAEINLNNSSSNLKGNQFSELKNGLGVLTQGYSLNNNSESSGSGVDLGLNYQLGFKGKKDRLLTFSYKYSVFNDDQTNRLNVYDRVIGYDESIFPDYNQVNNGESREQTIQADYVHPLKNLNIEAGVKAILRDNNSNFEYRSLNSSTGAFEPDPSKTNTFDNNQDVIGAYNSYQYNLKTWGFKAGLRIEETIVDADFISSGSGVNQNYFNVIPSVSVNKKLKNMSNINFGFTQRIQRPNIYNLNPFVDRSNPNFESTGNPGLKPVLNNNLQLSYSTFKKGSVNIGLNYSFANNTIQQLSVYDPVTQITRSTYENIGKDKSLGTNLNINYPITKKMSLNMGANMRFVWLQGMINGTLEKNHGINGYLFGSLGYKFENGWRLNASYSYSSPYITLQGQSNAYYYSALSVNKDIIKDKLSFSVSASNPFSKYRNYTNETSGPDFIQSSSSQNYFRAYGVNLSYRFGKLKSDIKKNQRKINNDDSSGGAKTTGN